MSRPDPKKPLKRYDIPDAERWPMKPEPVPEIRPDLEAPKSKKGDVSPIATDYGGMVSKFFNEKRKIADLTDVEDTELFDYDRFLVMEQQSLEKLSNPSTAESMRPEDVALTMGDLAGGMAARNPEIAGNKTGNASIDKETEKAYGDTKKLFMDTGKKIFPNIDVDNDDIGNELKLTTERLSRQVDPTGRIGQDLTMPDLTGKDIEAMMEDDPQALAAKLDKMIYETGDLMRMRSRIGFNDGDDADRSELAEGSKWLYKLQLIRDGLQEKMYDSKEVTSSEAGEIEKIRRAMGIGEKKEERVEAESPKTLEKPELAGDPALEALRGVFKDQDALAVRLAGLSERIKFMTALKLEGDTVVTPDNARRFSERQAFIELLPVEQRALAAAAEKIEKKTSSEQLFVELLRGLE